MTILESTGSFTKTRSSKKGESIRGWADLLIQMSSRMRLINKLGGTTCKFLTTYIDFRTLTLKEATTSETTSIIRSEGSKTLKIGLEFRRPSLSIRRLITSEGLVSSSGLPLLPLSFSKILEKFKSIPLHLVWSRKTSNASTA